MSEIEYEKVTKKLQNVIKKRGRERARLIKTRI